MSLNIEKIKIIIGQPESDRLEYKSVLPDSHTLAKHISAFSNAEGGLIIIGVKEAFDGKIIIVGISKEFNANQILYKALEGLNPKPNVTSGYISYSDKEVFVIDISPSKEEVFHGQVKYTRDKTRIASSADTIKEVAVQLNEYLDRARKKMLAYKQQATASLREFFASIDRYIILLNKTMQFAKEKIIIEKLVFSASADNFEKYLADLLYEIYLAQPNTLKNDEKTLSTKEVLDCDDMTAFVKYIAKKKIYSLEKGSIKGFLKDNKQIAALEALSEFDQELIEKILQIRHLFTHRNGIIDEKFNRYFNQIYKVGEQLSLSLEEISDNLITLITAAANISNKAIEKYNLNIEKDLA